MAADNVKPEVQKTVPPTDASEAAKAAREAEAEAARLKLSQESQAAKPLTAKEKTTLRDTEHLAHDIIKAFTDKGKAVPEANRALNDFVNAKDDAGRAKVFTDANVQAPDYVQTYEATYGASTTDAIRSSVLLAKRVEQEQKASPGERHQPTDARVPAPAPAPTAADTSPAAILDNASDTIAKSLNTLQAGQADGKPLSDSSKQIFQAAIDATSKITPAILDAKKEALYGSVPGWSDPTTGKIIQAKEDQYRAVHKAVADALKNLSPDVEKQLAKLPAETKLADQIAAVEAMTNDPSAMKLKQAHTAAQNFYKANPGANQRDAINENLGVLSDLSHGKAIASAVYAGALAKTGNAGDIPQAKAMMTEAAKDPHLSYVFPEIQKAYDNIMSAAGPTAPAEDPLDKIIPGWTQKKAAEAAMSDQSLSPEQRVAKAAPLFAGALNAAKTIDYAAIETAKHEVNTRVIALTQGKVHSMDELLKPENKASVKTLLENPATKDKTLELYGQNNVLNKLREQNVVTSEAYAQSLTKAASDLQAQANSKEAQANPANVSKFNAEANAMTGKAVSVLQTIGQADPNFGVAFGVGADGAPPSNADDMQHKVTLNQKRIAEEIAQANRGEVIDKQKAAGATGARVAFDAINDPIMGDGSLNLSKTLRPLEVGVNTTIEAFDFAHAHVPVAGKVAGWASDMMKGFLPSPDTAMPNAVEDLANAKVADPVAAKAVIDDKKESAVNNAVSLGSDLLSGQIGVIAAEKALPGAIGQGATIIKDAAVVEGKRALALAGQVGDAVLTQAVKASLPKNLAEKVLASSLFERALPQMEESIVKAGLESGNWKVKLGAAATVSVAAAFGSRWAADELSHDFLGTKRMSAGEIASHSTAALAAAYTARGLTSAIPATDGVLAKKLAQTALTSGTTSTVFGLGEVNPFVTNKATGQHFTAADTLMYAGENLAFGATTGMAGRAVAPFVNFSTVGVAHGIGSFAKGAGKIVFNSKAGLEVAGDAGAVASAAMKEIMPVLPGWTGGFMGLSLNSSLARGAVGAGVGGVGAFVAVNPWETNSATGKNYTWGESALNAAEVGSITGAVSAVAPHIGALPGIGYRAAANALPGEGSTLTRFMANNRIAAGERFAVGSTVGFLGNLAVGNSTDANGNEYTWSQRLGTAATYGVEFGAGGIAAPYLYSGIKAVAKPIVKPIGNGINASRRFLGRTAEGAGSMLTNGAHYVAGEGTVIGNKVVVPSSQLGMHFASEATRAADTYGPGTRQYLLSHSLQVSTALSSFYEYNKLKNLDQLSDERAEAIKKEQAGDQ